jgi:hypothetical protein
MAKVAYTFPQGFVANKHQKSIEIRISSETFTCTCTEADHVAGHSRTAAKGAFKEKPHYFDLYFYTYHSF